MRRNDGDEREWNHFVWCDEPGCRRCAEFARRCLLRSRRALNLIFATIWVAIGTGAAVVILYRVLGR